MSNFSTFEMRVKKCRKKKLPDILENCSEDHAFFLFEQLLDEAKETKEDVKIISGELRDSFYNGLVDKIKSIPSEVKVELTVLKRRDFSGNKFIEAIAEKKSCHVWIPDSAVGHQKEIFHLIIVGDKKFRVETNHDNATALASFNSPNFGKTLLSMSEHYFPPLEGFCIYPN